MDDKQLQDLKDHLTKHQDENIEKGIKKHVNGNIKELAQRLDEYIKDDTEWKELAQPAIDLGKNIKSFGLVSLYLLGAIAALGAAFASIKGFFIPK